MKMNPVVHFEMPAKDKKRVAEFYTKAFGWQMTQLGSEMGNYLLATTTETEQPGMPPKNPGAINGGFFEYGNYGSIPHLVISVEDLKKHIEIVKNAGGKIEGDPMDIPGIGNFVMIKDTEGNRIGILQPAPMNNSK